jgi:hypothetical protein
MKNPLNAPINNNDKNTRGQATRRYIARRGAAAGEQ